MPHSLAAVIRPYTILRDICGLEQQDVLETCVEPAVR
jgi:hypothetical protein